MFTDSALDVWFDNSIWNVESIGMPHTYSDINYKNIQSAWQGIALTAELESDFNRHIEATYGSPKSFHADCKTRLKAFQEENNLKASWSDSCLTPILVIDYINGGGKCEVPEVKGMKTYGGI